MGHQMFMYSKNLKEHWPEASANPIHDNWLAQTGTQMQISLYNPCGKLTECRSEHHITKSRLARIRPTHMNPNSHFQVLAVTRSASPHAPKSDLRLHAEPGPTHHSGGGSPAGRRPRVNLRIRVQKCASFEAGRLWASSRKSKSQSGTMSWPQVYNGSLGNK